MVVTSNKIDQKPHSAIDPHQSHHHGTPCRCKANADFFIVYSPAKEDLHLRTVAEQDRFHQSIENVCPRRSMLISDLNVLIMNYLVHQGYPSAAVSFAREANLALSKESVESITARMEVRNKIHAGDIEGAIHDINALNPQVNHHFL